MPTKAQPQRALARLDALTAVALIRAAVKSPAVLLGVIAIVAIAGFGLADRLRSVELDTRTVFIVAVGLSVMIGAGFVSQARAALEGPFGFVLIRPADMTGLILRRAGTVLLLLMAGLLALVGAVRPEAWLMVAGVALPGAALGLGLGMILWLGWAHGAAQPQRAWTILTRLKGWGPRLWRAAPSLALWLLAIQARGYGAETSAQILTTAAAVSGVLAVLPVDPVRLNLLATAPQSMARLIMPLAVAPLLAGVAGGTVAGLISGLTPGLAAAAGLALGVIGALARVFLGLAALGRSETAARSAGAVELLVAVILPFAGPLAIGSAALVWIGGRMVWLWRRGRRVRWLDPEGER